MYKSYWKDMNVAERTRTELITACAGAAIGGATHGLRGAFIGALAAVSTSPFVAHFAQGDLSQKVTKTLSGFMSRGLK